MSHEYKVRYKIDMGEYSVEDLKAGDFGGSDQILICSILDHADGSGSYAWLTANGHTHGEVEAHKQLNALVLLADKLSRHEDLGKGSRDFCANIFETYRRAKIANRG